MQSHFFIFCLFFLFIYTQHPFENNLLKSFQNDKYQTFIADPIGLMFNKFTNFAEKKDHSELWWPDFMYNEYKYDENKQIESTSNIKQVFTGTIIENSKTNQIVTENIQLKDYNTINITNIIHIPVDTPDTECHDRGVKVGEIKNICTRNDCHVNILRCLPDLSVIVNNQNYSLVNLSSCYVEELQCLDHIFTFDDWSETKIYQLLCNGEITDINNGDLDHCSVLSIIEDTTLLNFTLTSYDDTKCWIDEIQCPRYCDNIIVNCNDIKIDCPYSLRCIDDYIYCNYTLVECNGNPVSCDSNIVECNDYYPTCSNFSVICDNTNPCLFNMNGTIIEYEPECNEEGLILCNNTLIECDGHVVSCSDTERTFCNDIIKKQISYIPDSICIDDLHDCSDIFVFCDDYRIYCDDGYTWLYNITLSRNPVCVSNTYAFESQWYDDWYAIHALSSDASSDEIEEFLDTPSFVLAKEMCRVGEVTFHCNIETCTNKTFDCGNELIYCSPNNTDIINLNSTYIPQCNGTDMLCTSDPQCNIHQKKCENNEFCSSYVYECNIDTPTNCSYKQYNCSDGCWAREGEWECICPLDYWGDDCKDHRPYVCDINLIEPYPNCIPYDDPELNKLETDPICLLYSVHDSIRFTYQTNCYFTNLTNIEKSNDNRTSFSYYARRGNEFAISSFLDDPKILLKIFDFNRLSDSDESILLTLTNNQIANYEPFFIDINISPIFDSSTRRQKYFTGGRMYFEVDIYNEGYGTLPSGMEYRKTDRRFIDFTDFELVEEKIILNENGFGYYLYIQLSDPTLIIVLFISGMSIYYFVKKHQNYKIKEELNNPKIFKND